MANKSGMPLSPVTFDRQCYRIGGKPAYLYSGEFHYFRVPARDWRRRMRLFKEAGGNCLATYVPWLIHEPEEGRFTFGAKPGSHGLEPFLETAAAEGLFVVVRPGPYQYSELQYDGLPRWLCEGYPDLHAMDPSGRIFRQASVSYLHPLFLEKVDRWFATVCPRLARWTVSRGGPVAFAQFDNELGGIHTWFGSLDYNPTTLGMGNPDGRFPRFLRARYGDIGRLNACYGAAFASFADVTPGGPAVSGLAGMRQARDFFQFYQTMLAEYAGHLCALMREHGIDTPFVHNSANPSMNAWFKPLADTLGEPFVLGSDHYYMLNQDSGQNNPTPQHAVSVFTSLETLRVMGMPPTVFELPGGSLSDWPPFTPEDAKAFYLMNIAFGMKGSNFYILTGGPNVRGTGTTTDVYDYGASIGPRGEIRPLYRTQKQVGLFLKGNPWLMEAGQEAGFRLGLDFEQLVADAYGWRTGADLALSPGDAWSFAQRGILSTAFCASLAPTCVDLGDDAWVADRGTPLAVASSAVMGRAIQQRLVRFLRGGGRLLLAPVVPTLDENLEPCTLLADYLGGVKTVRCAAPYSRLSIGGVSNVYKNGDVFYLDGAPGGAQAVGVDEISGRLMAARWQPDGGGDVLVLGFRWSQGKREHEAMLTVLLKGLGLKRVLSSSNPNVWLTLRTAGCRSALFVMNLLSAPQTVRVTCRPSWSRRTIDTGPHRLPPMTIRVIRLRKR